MAATAITIVESPATIEADETGAVITKNTGLNQMSGVLVNAGLVTVWLKISLTDTAATAPALTNAQAQLTVGLPPGANFPWLAHYKSIFHKTAAGTTSTLYWYPDGPTSIRR